MAGAIATDVSPDRTGRRGANRRRRPNSGTSRGTGGGTHLASLSDVMKPADPQADRASQEYFRAEAGLNEDVVDIVAVVVAIVLVTLIALAC